MGFELKLQQEATENKQMSAPLQPKYHRLNNHILNQLSMREDAVKRTYLYTQNKGIK
jgi:hypothetical protein